MALFAACTAHWLDANPQPDLTSWAVIEDPEARLRAGLAELYAYYRRAEGMLANVLRDEATMPTVARMLAFYRGYLARAGEALMAGRRERGRVRRRVRAAIGHALAFATWRSLVRDHNLDDAEAAELMCGLVELARRAR